MNNPASPFYFKTLNLFMPLMSLLPCKVVYLGLCHIQDPLFCLSECNTKKMKECWHHIFLQVISQSIACCMPDDLVRSVSNGAFSPIVTEQLCTENSCRGHRNESNSLLYAKIRAGELHKHPSLGCSQQTSECFVFPLDSNVAQLSDMTYS